MGREIAEAVPEAMEVYRRRQRGVRPRPAEALLRHPPRGPRRDRGATAGPGRDVPGDPRGDPARGLEPDVVVGHSVGEFAALAAVARSAPARRSASCASEGSRWPRRRRSTPARWPRSSGSRTRPSRHCAARSWESGRRTTTVPGQIVVSGENDAVEECCAEAESLGARRAIKLKVSGAFHSPLVARAADRLQARARLDPLPRPDRAVHVDRDREGRARDASRVAARRSADRAGAVHAGGTRARPRRRHDVRRGRARERALRARQADRSQRPHDRRQRPREPGEGPGDALARERLLLARGEDGARHRRLARDRPGDRARARRAPARRSSSGIASGRTRQRPSLPRSAAARCRPTSPTRRPRRRSSRRPETSTSSSTTPA